MNKTRLAASLFSVLAVFALTTGCAGTTRAERTQHVAQSWATDVVELQMRLDDLTARYRAIPNLETGVLQWMDKEKARMGSLLHTMELQRRGIAQSGDSSGVHALGESMLEMHRGLDELSLRIIVAGMGGLVDLDSLGLGGATTKSGR